MEAQITKDISSRFICDWLYIYMWLTFVVGAIYLLLGIGGAVIMKGTLVTKALMVLPSFIMAGFLALMGLSFYIICERGLKPEKKSELH